MTDSQFYGTGWSFPPTFEIGNYKLNIVKKEETINQAIDILLHTKKGERSLFPSFGSDLGRYLFRVEDASLMGEIKHAVETCLIDHEPRITVESVKVDSVKSSEGRINILITYTVKKTNTRHNYVFPYHINEGTNL